MCCFSFSTSDSRGFHLFTLKVLKKAHKAVERLDDKVVYQFINLVIGFDMKTLVIVPEGVVLSF